MMRRTHSYKQKPVGGHWDAIVIGSGLGGLTTAAILAKEGAKVLVLERHATAGGYTHVFKRRDYEWDVGLHYVGDVHRSDRFLRQLFDYVTDGKLRWAPMGAVYDRIRFGEREYRIPAGPAAFAAQLKSYFPAPPDREAIDRYLALIRRVDRCRARYFSEKALPPRLAWALAPFMRAGFLKYADQTTLSVLQRLTDNEHLIGVLTGQYGTYGLPPSQSSFAMHALVVKHFLYGANYPIGGSARLLDTILPVIQTGGGAVYTNADVRQVHLHGGSARGVVMADGRTIRSDSVVSDVGVLNTCNQLLPPDCLERSGLKAALNSLTRSASHLCLYIGLQQSAQQLDLGTANYWLYPDRYDHQTTVQRYLGDPTQDFPFLFISFPSAKDPDWERRYPGRSTIEIIALAPYDRFTQWEGRRWQKRGKRYRALKQAIALRMLEQLYHVEPQLRGNVDYYELSTPLSTRHFSHYPKGEIYGLDHSPQRFRQRCLRAHTPIRHLYLTGQDIAVAGIAGAINSGLLTATAMLGKPLLGKIIGESENRRSQ